MKILNFLLLPLIILVAGCSPKVNCQKISSITFCSEKEIKLVNEETLTEGMATFIKLDNLNIKIVASYYSDNLYEYDVQLVRPLDTSQINSLKDNNIPFIIAENKKSVDLDYHRKYNVYFDTVNNIALKLLKPRKPFTQDYVCFVAKIPNSYMEGVGYKSLRVICDNVSSELDIEKFEKFVKSMRVVGSVQKV